MDNTKNSRLDRFFGNPVCAVVLAVVLNMLWGCAFPFIKLGYSFFSIDPSNLPSILVFAGTRFSFSGLFVLVFGSLLQRRALLLPRKRASLKVLGLGLWQTSLQYLFYYWAVAHLTGKMGSVINATSSFMVVILAHFLYGAADRMTGRKAAGCVIGFAGVVLACLSPDNGGTVSGVLAMLAASVIFACSGPLNKSLCREFDGFTVSGYNLLFGGLVLLALGLSLGGRLAVTSPFAYADMFALCFISSVGYVMNALLMKNNPVSRIGVFGMCIPITTNILTAALYPESYTLGPVYAVALVCVCAGIFLVNKPKKAVSA